LHILDNRIINYTYVNEPERSQNISEIFRSLAISILCLFYFTFVVSLTLSERLHIYHTTAAEQSRFQSTGYSSVDTASATVLHYIQEAQLPQRNSASAAHMEGERG